MYLDRLLPASSHPLSRVAMCLLGPLSCQLGGACRWGQVENQHAALHVRHIKLRQY